MKKRYRGFNYEIDLFPFISILACTIGTLILLIIVITTQVMGTQQQVRIIAREELGNNYLKTPEYIECRSDGVIIYPDQEFVPFSSITSSSSAFQKLLDDIRRHKDNKYLIIVIREDGVKTFKEIRKLLEAEEIDIGYEPLEEGWELKI